MTNRIFRFFAFVHYFFAVNLAFAEETLQFANSPIGYVTVSPPQVSQEGFMPDPEPYFCRHAVGQVTIPTDGLLGLELIGNKIVNANDLPPLPTRTSLLKVSNAVLSKGHMAKLSELKELTNIAFEQCQFSDNAFDSLGHFPQLKSCRITLNGDSSTIEPRFITWVIQHEKLEQLVVMPQLSSNAISKLSTLPNLKAIHASLDANAAMTLSALKHLRSLEFLNVSVTNNCPPDALDSVGELGQLRSYRQVLGKVSNNALTRLAEHDRLEQLDLALVDIDPDSLNAIAKIKSLKELKLSTHDDNPLNDLAKVCRELPRLTSWPQLNNLSRDDLTLILSHPDTERLSLKHLDSTLKPRDLTQLAQLKNLKELKVEGIPVDDAWLTKMSSLSRLETLNLFDTQIVGHGFAAFSGHKNLRQLIIFVGSYEDAHIDLDLSTLSGTNLESLQIMGPYDGDSLKGLGAIESLSELRLFGDLLGSSDDSLTNELCQLPRLRELTLTGNSFITDAGAHELSKMDTLQSLMVSGFVTEQGVAELAKIPSLRRLIVASSKVDSNLTQEMPETLIRAFVGNVDDQGLSLINDLEMGEDGFPRKSQAKQLEKIRQLEGNPPPKLAVTNFGKGESFKLEDYRGKVVLIDFWGTWCGPCRFQMPKLQALYKEYQSAGLEIVSIHTSSGSENLAPYLERKELPWVQLIDDEDSTVKRFYVPHYPSIYLVDRAGNLRVALAHPTGLDDSVKKLLSEGQ